MRRTCLALALGATLFGCGARSSLLTPDDDDDGSGQGGDASQSPASSSGRPGDGGGPSQGTGGEGAGGEGTGGEPPFIEQCDDTALFVYVLTDSTDLYRFDPVTVAFEPIGAVECPTDFGNTPFSMAVSRSGRAYSVYSSGEVFRINVANASCRATDWEPLANDFRTFGMGYAIDDDGLGESLYVADIDGGIDVPSAGLGRLDTNDFTLDVIGGFSENPGEAIELTSSDDGELYGYFIDREETGGTLVRIDKATAEVLEETPLPPPATTGSALAFAYWNGDFYIFTSGGVTTDVTRYRPSTGEVGVIATLDRVVVGAGVTTCDPDDADGV